MRQLDSPPLAAPMTQFQVIAQLGKGAYSTVHRVLRRADHCEYALKVVNLGCLDEKMVQNSLNEARILASVNCRFVVRYKEAFLDRPSHSLYIVTEYVDGGDLAQLIGKVRTSDVPRITEDHIWSIFIQVVYGLRALHKLRIIHRDLKTANIFLSTDGQVKIGDLNVSKISKGDFLRQTQTGTPCYASPEVWNNAAYSSQSDMWSLGCCLYEMLTLRTPFQADDMDQLYERVTRGDFAAVDNSYSSELRAMLHMLLTTDATR